MRTQRVLAAALLMACVGLFGQACGEEVVAVKVRMATSQRGFACEDAAGTPLIQRVVDSGTACVVGDFVRWKATPSCRFAELGDACCSDGCHTLRARKQIPLDVPALLELCVPEQGGAFDPDCPASFVLAALRELAWLDAPEGLVSLRVTVTNQDCETITEDPADANELGDYPSFPAESLVGCVFSCPADLANQESDLVLDLDVVDTRCEAVVAACANLLGPGSCQ